MLSIFVDYDKKLVNVKRKFINRTIRQVEALVAE
jgi:hypothetical protein